MKRGFTLDLMYSCLMYLVEITFSIQTFLGEKEAILKNIYTVVVCICTASN